MTRVVVAAPSAVVRAGLESLLRSTPDLEVVASGPAISHLVRGVAVPDADVLLIDLDRGGTEGLPALRALGQESGSPALIVLTGNDGIGAIEALRLGVRALLPREAEADEIIAAVRAAASGLVVLHPDSVEGLLSHVPQGREATEQRTEELTPREIEVLTMLAEGAGNKMIARRLGISEHTVKFHVGSILGKLSAASRTEAVTIGIRQGLILI